MLCPHWPRSQQCLLHNTDIRCCKSIKVDSACNQLCAGEGLRKGLRDMQQHAARQTTGKRELDGNGGQAANFEGHSDVEPPPKRPEAAQRDASSSTFLKSLKARYRPSAAPDGVPMVCLIMKATSRACAADVGTQERHWLPC